MTLVVGKIFDNRLMFVSDTRLTDISEIEKNPLHGVLKSIIVDPTTSVHFSGNPTYAEKLLIDYYSQLIPTIEDLTSYCLNLNIESENETHFLIGITVQKEAHLIRIKDRKIEYNLKSAWIGDKKGFAKFQQKYFELDENIDSFHKMNLAFKEVLEDGSLETIGDFKVVTATVYHPEVDDIIQIYGGGISLNSAEMEVKSNYVNKLEVGPPETGAYVLSQLRSLNVFDPALVLHFPQGKFGMLFYPKLNYFRPLLFKSIEAKILVDLVWNEYKIVLEGFILNEFGSKFQYIRNLP